MKYTLKEDNSGGLLLHYEAADGVALVFTRDEESMARLLRLARSEATAGEVIDEAGWGEDIEEEEQQKTLEEWEQNPIIADNDGVYRRRACQAGSRAIQLALLAEDPLKELAECSDAEEVADLVQFHTELVWNGRMTAHPDNMYARHELADKICRIQYDLDAPSSFDELETLVTHWETVCLNLCGTSHLDIGCYCEDDEWARYGSFKDCDTVEFSAEGGSFHGYRNYELAASLADMVGECLNLGSYEYQRDGENEWFVFRK